MILVNNTLVQGQHDFYKRVGITLSEENNEEQNPVSNPNENPENPENPVLNPGENPTSNPENEVLDGGGK